MTHGSSSGGGDRSRIERRSNRPETDEPRWRYELKYELDHGLVDHRPEHEAWLFEWALEFHDVGGISELCISRREDERSTTTTITIERSSSDALLETDGVAELFERLLRWVGDVDLRSEPAANAGHTPIDS
ncbi:hypothetical protein [Natrarchaeobaculum sulfurireducens]|uniref:Uncharacterized protein n=1 Tax=Natrarchaeobaculum sulfurireducens TaxID=2044521 RepID=A0A346PEM2_9EURY|nr:hypothetical protein [Natrarchaeobaculum sulfurireducens]AXR77967.1 hypothetical protein AArc1_1636 [Natrarchaeobaculum sulfurireducens]